jgi:hypothetical protein
MLMTRNRSWQERDWDQRGQDSRACEEAQSRACGSDGAAVDLQVDGGRSAAVGRGILHRQERRPSG